MTAHDEDDGAIYVAVANHEEQYSIWLADRELPPGWRDAGKRGTKAECLAYIAEVWTDMRPLSLRRQMAEWERSPPAEEPAPDSPPPHPLGKDELVARLEHEQPVTIGARSRADAEALREQIARGYVFVRFTKTGTELGVKLDPAARDRASAELAASAGHVSLVGDLELNDNVVRCHARIDPSTLDGTGRLSFVRATRLP